MTALHQPKAVAGVLAACAFLSACGGDDAEDNPYALPRDDTKVVVTPIYQECASDADCTLWDITCDVCCEQQAISTSLVDVFENERRITCAAYEGPVCSCIQEPLAAVCNNGTCATTSAQ